MKKIFNWVFGSFFRTLGRYLFYILMGFGLAIILPILIEKFDISLPESLLSSLILDVRADELEYSYSQYRVQTTGTSSSWTPLTNFNTSTSNSIVERTVSGLAVRFGRTNNFKANTSYAVVVNVGFAPTQSLNNLQVSKVDCYTSSSVSNWVTNSSNISTCSLRNIVKVDNSNTFRFVFEVTPATAAPGLQFNFYFVAGVSASSINVYNTSTITDTNDTSVEQAIKNQNLIIQNGFTQIQGNIDSNFNELEDKLLDDELNDDDIKNVFDDLEIEETSLNGFSNFLMVPLHWAETFLRPNQVCQPIQIPLPYLQNKYLTLSCMNDFWQNLGPLAALVDLVWVAVVGVRIFNGLFVLTIDILSPKDNDDDLTKIKSWEL